MAKKSKKSDVQNSDPTDIESWVSRIKRAERFRDEADKRYGFSRAIAQYQGDFKSVMPSFISDTDIVPINEVYSFMKTFVPSVYARDPHISANPQGYSWIAGAKLIELYINSYWRELNLKREVRRVIIDAGLAEGWVKCGYTSVFGSINNDDGKPLFESNEFIQNDEIFAARVSWRNIARDPDSINGTHDARWIAERIIKPLEAVKASSLYENTEDLQPSFIVSNPLAGSYGFNKKKLIQGDEVPYAVLYEIWDRDTQTVSTISEGSAKFLSKKDWPYKMEGFPYVMLRFNENPDETFAPNLISPWEPQLWEKIKLRAMELDHLKRYNRQMSIEEGAMSEKEISKLTLGKTGSIIKRKKGSKTPEPIPYPPIQADIYGVENRIDMDKDNISGQPNAVRGAAQRTQSRTLGEINTLISSFQARQTEPQAIVEDFAEEIAFKLIKLSQQFMSGEKYVRATQKDFADIQKAFIDPVTGESKFDGRGFKFTREDIQDVEFDIDIKTGSTLPLNRENRIEAMSNLLKLGPTIGIAPNGNVARVIGKNLIAEFDMKEAEQAYEEEMRQVDAQKILADKMQEQSIKLNEMKVKNMQKTGPDGLAAMGGLSAGGQSQPQSSSGGIVPMGQSGEGQG